MVAVWGAGATSILECVEDWKTDICARCIALSTLSLFSCIAVLFALCRVFLLTRKIMSYQTFVLSAASLQSICLVVLYFFYAKLHIFIVLEFLKVLVLLVVALFFTTSALRMLHKDNIRLKVWLVGVDGSIHLLRCRTQKRMQSVLHFFLALCLCLTALFVFKALKSPNTRLSHEYKIRHTRPMATLATIYGFSALTNLLFRIFLFVRSPEAKDTCHELLKANKPWFIWTSMVFLIIDLFLPLWTLVWYFERTVKESTYTSSSKMDYVWQSLQEESEVEGAEGRVIQQPFLVSGSSSTSPSQSPKPYPSWPLGSTTYQTYRVEVAESEEDGGQDTDYTDLEENW